MTAVIPLPQFTFVTGPKESGKTTLIELLRKQDPSLCVIAFAEPIRMALMGAFYPDALLDCSIDPREQSFKNTPIPSLFKNNKPVTSRDWMIDFGRWMRLTYGPDVFSNICERTWQEQSHFYSRAIFDGTRTKDDLAAFRPKGVQNILIIHLSRDGADWGSDIHEDLFGAPGKHFAMQNDGPPEQMLTKLRQFLLLQQENPTPPTGMTISDL